MARRPSLLARLLRGAHATPQAPITSADRARLEHERRRLLRALRELQRSIGRHHCSSCVRAEDPAGVALDRRARALREELGRIEDRLASD